MGRTPNQFVQRRSVFWQYALMVCTVSTPMLVVAARIMWSGAILSETSRLAGVVALLCMFSLPTAFGVLRVVEGHFVRRSDWSKAKSCLVAGRTLTVVIVAADMLVLALVVVNAC